MTVNVPLLRKAVEWVEEQVAVPEIDRQWRQRTWVTQPRWKAEDLLEPMCTSARGLIDFEKVYKLAKQVEPHCGTAYCVAGYVAQLVDESYQTNSYGDGGVHCSVVAAKALGIPYVLSSAGIAQTELFEGNNTAEGIRYFAEYYAGEKL